MSLFNKKKQTETKVAEEKTETKNKKTANVEVKDNTSKTPTAKKETTKSAKPATKDTTKKVDAKETKPAAKTTTKKVEVKEQKPKAEDVKPETAPVATPEETKTTKKPIYRVVYDKSSRLWVIKKDGAKRNIASFVTKDEAMNRVKALSGTQELNFIVHKKDGKFQKK